MPGHSVKCPMHFEQSLSRLSVQVYDINNAEDIVCEDIALCFRAHKIDVEGKR